MMATTIKDVAKLAKTSTATVSKVINGSYSISEATVNRVQQAMKELNYHKNSRAVNFAKQATRTIMFASSIEKGCGFTNPHMFEMMFGLESTLSSKNYALMIKNIAKERACAYIKEMIDTRMVDGVVIHASIISKELDELIYNENIPHLVIGTPDFSNHFCWIDVDNKLAGEIAAKYLLEKGYQSIAFIGGKDEDKISMHRLEGVLNVLKEHDVIIPNNYIQHGESIQTSGYLMTKNVIQTKNRLDAIICANNYIAYGCMNALHDYKITIPKEVAVLTFDDYPFSRLLKPNLTVVDIDVFDVGVQAGRYMLQKIKKPNLSVQSYITLPILMVREST